MSSARLTVVFLICFAALGAGLLLRGGAVEPTAPTQPQVPYVPTAPPPSGPFQPVFRQTDGSPVRWNPCAPVHWVFNPVGAPEGALADVKQAFALTAQATQMRFVYDGTTTEQVASNRQLYQPAVYGEAWAPVLVSWVAPGSTSVNIGRQELGVGIPTSVSNDQGRDVLVSGQVIINSSRTFEPGFARPRNRGMVVLHEIGHVMGLDHVNDRWQVMAPFVDQRSGSGRWGIGDAYGLHRMGRAQGCVTPPTPQTTR